MSLNNKTIKTSTIYADLLWQDDIPVNKMFDDPYFSLANGEAESQYVFLTHNNIPHVFSDQNIFSIAETGFGTGLNFFVTAKNWVGAHGKENCNEYTEDAPHLFYFSIERYPISKQELMQIYCQWSQYHVFSDQLIAQYAGNVSGFHQINFPSQNITLILMIGDVEAMLLEMDVEIPNKIDAWFLDGFSPAKNPNMWSEGVFQKIAKLSHAKTTFATFTAAGFVRRAMKSSGFDVKKASGFGKKREMLHGNVIAPCTSRTSRTQSFLTSQANSQRNIYIPPWYSLNNIYKSKKAKPKMPVVIIGGGIAGLSCALALAEKNIRSIVIESAAAVGAGASGNKAGIVMPRINAAQDAESAFYINSFYYAVNYYHELNKRFPELQWLQNGVLKFDTHNKLSKIKKLSLPNDLVKIVDAVEASKLANVKIKDSALYMRQAGTINPLQLCDVFIKSAGEMLQTVLQKNVSTLEKNGDTWLIKDEKNHVICSAEKVIIANGYDASRLLKTENLTVESSRGQLSYVAATEQSSKLKTNLCGDGYVVPAQAGEHVLGASYGGNSNTLMQRDHEKNLQNARLLLNDELNDKPWGEAQALSGRVSFRTTTKDHLPVVGPVIDEEYYLTHYHDLHHGKSQNIYKKAEYIDGLFLSVGHGSRGLVTCVSSAKYITSLIAEHPIAEAVSTIKLLHPGRFLVRNLAKGAGRGRGIN